MMKRRTAEAVLALAGVVTIAELLLVRLGKTYGSTRAERAMSLPGDEIIPRPVIVTNHAIDIAAPPASVWPWLVQMGWGRGGWYTARWVDRLLFPANGPSAKEIVDRLQHLDVGDFIPDGPPEVETGFVVEQIIPERALVLHSTSHLPASWRRRGVATVDWSWTFHLFPVDGGNGTRYLFRSRWTTTPWWLSAGGLLAIVPADFVMARGHMHGLRSRVENLR